jgi:hypothetical protein
LIRVWVKEARYGTELAEVEVGEDRLSGSGIAIGLEPVPYRLEYELATGAEFVTKRLVVRTRGEGWRRGIDLRRDPSGTWSVDTQSEGVLDRPPPGGDLIGLEGALDCDLGLSPLTNTMPVLRHRLHEGDGSLDFVMAWVSVPDLAVYASPQRYTFRRPGVVEYRGLDSGFVADLAVDQHGLVVAYPGLARLG